MPSAGQQLDQELALGLGTHVSRRVTSGDLEEADLALTMTRAHARELLILEPQIWPRVFTLKQFAHWSEGRHRGRGQDLRAWLTDAGASRQRWEIVGESAVDDTADPVLEPLRAWRTMAAEMDRSITSMSHIVVGDGGPD